MALRSNHNRPEDKSVVPHGSRLVFGAQCAGVQSANEVIIIMIGEFDEPDALPRRPAAPSLQLEDVNRGACQGRILVMTPMPWYCEEKNSSSYGPSHILQSPASASSDALPKSLIAPSRSLEGRRGGKFANPPVMQLVSALDSLSWLGVRVIAEFARGAVYAQSLDC